MRSERSTTSPARTSRVARYGPLLFWILLIFILSTGEASAEQTSRIIRPILQLLFPSATEASLIFYHSIIRKSAHVVVYALLAFWAARAFSRSSHRLLRENRYWAALAVVLAVAMLDELNQSMQAVRTGAFLDVVLDVTGGIAMTAGLKLLDSRRSTGRDS